MPDNIVSIEIGSATNSKNFKSIRHVVWEDIPPFCILTGRNGAGKSQLLEFLALRISGAASWSGSPAQHVPLNISGITVGPEDVVYVPSNWTFNGFGGSSIDSLRSAKEQVRSWLSNANGDVNHLRQRAQLAKLLGPSVDLNNLQNNDKLKDDYSFMIDEGNVGVALSHLFVAYRLKRLNDLEDGLNEEQARKKNGPPPWDVLNEVLDEADFGYRASTPIGTKITDGFQVTLKSTTGAVIHGNDLSSGEQAILQTILWLYYSQHQGRFPKLLLLDEPDAHLHPAMTRQFLNVLHEILVKKYGVRVILATHSPSTVALAPENSIYEMKRGQAIIAKSPSKQDAIGLLTAGLLTVGEGTRFCFVEDHDDVAFYNCVRDLLSDFGPLKDKRALKPAPSIVFLPVCSGKNNSKIGGGCKVVEEWVQRFSSSGLSHSFCGLIDRDDNNLQKDGLSVLNRFSFENYLIDPINVFVALLPTSKNIKAIGINLDVGEEHTLSGLAQDKLQALADSVLSKVAIRLPSLTEKDKELVDVNYTCGISIKVPKWMIDTRGKNLLQKLREEFDGSLITLDSLITAMKRTRLIPVDLAETLTKIQNGSQMT